MRIKKHQPDYWLLTITVILVVFGLLMLGSASADLSLNKFGHPYYYLKHQIIYGLLLGCAGFYLFQKLNYQHLRKISLPFFFVSLVLLILVFIPSFGAAYHKTKRWLNLGGVSFQPAEIMKLAFILYLSGILSKNSLKFKKSSTSKKETGRFLLLTGLVCGLIAKQPDLSTAILIGLTSLVIYFAAGGKISHLIPIVIIGLLGVLFLIKISPYRMDRLTIFLHPEIDPQGKGYQINQALLAIGSGGVFGRGLAHSLQKFKYLPEPFGDSIFAIIAEEGGFLTSSLLLLGYLFFVFRGWRISLRLPDEFSRLVALGITSWIIFQSFMNIAAISGLMPLTGIPLPFISYGGSSLAITLTAVGVLFGLSRYTRRYSRN